MNLTHFTCKRKTVIHQYKSYINSVEIENGVLALYTNIIVCSHKEGQMVNMIVFKHKSRTTPQGRKTV